MKSGKPQPVSIETLEGRTFMSASPLAAETARHAPAHVMHADVTTKSAKTESLAQYVAGTWEFTIGRVFGVTMAYDEIWSANGTYRIGSNFKYAPDGLPIQTAWTTLDYGTWTAMTGALVPGVNGLITAKSHNGSTSDVYVHADTTLLADFGVRPAGSMAAPVWEVWGKLV